MPEWKLVPVEPDWSMQIAGRDAILAEDDELDLSTDDARAAYLAMLAAAPQAGGGFTLVPNAALLWLNGEGPDDNGHHFGDGPEAEQRTAGRPRRFWWRAVFRRMIQAATPTDPDAIRKAARDEALEEAARSLDSIWAAYRRSSDAVFEMDLQGAEEKSRAIAGIADVVAECAQAIRALSKPAPPSEGGARG